MPTSNGIAVGSGERYRVPWTSIINHYKHNLNLPIKSSEFIHCRYSYIETNGSLYRYEDQKTCNKKKINQDV